MSSKRPSETKRIGKKRKLTGSFEGGILSPLRLSPAPIRSSIEMDSSFDNRSILPLDMVGVDHACNTDTLPPVAPMQFGSASGPGLETHPTSKSFAPNSPLSPSLSDAIMQVSKSEQNPYDSGSDHFANAPNTVITGGTFRPMSLATPTQLSSSLPDAISESHQNLSTDSGSDLFANAQNVLITGGTFINILPTNTKERVFPLLQKPNSSSLFVGRKDVLDKLQKIFIHCADSKLMSRRSCLLWGTGGIGKTQICLKFIEEISGRLSHVFWVDASSVESITLSLRGISSISAACHVPSRSVTLPSRSVTLPSRSEHSSTFRQVT